MAIAATTLIQEITDTNSTSYTTASFTITSGRPVLIGVVTAETTVSTTPTIIASSHGSTYTWAQESTQETDGGSVRRRITVFSALPGSTGSGTITVDTGSNTQSAWSVHVIEFTGADNTDIVRQAVANRGNAFGTVTVTLAAFGQATNGSLGFFTMNNQATLTVGSGFTLEGGNSQASADAPTYHLSEFAINDTTVDCSIPGASNRRWVGIALELKETPASNTITALPATATADAIVPTASVVLVAVLATATAAGIVASLPVSYVPTGILGDVTIKGIAELGNFTPGNSSAPSAVFMLAVTATATGTAIAPTIAADISGITAAAAGDAGTDPPVITVELPTFAVASAAAMGLLPTPVVVLPAVKATATADAIIASLTSGADILAIAAGAFGAALIPVVGVTQSAATATATADGIVVTLGVEVLGFAAESLAEAPAPTAGSLVAQVNGELSLTSELLETLELTTVLNETLELTGVIRESLTLEVIEL